MFNSGIKIEVLAGMFVLEDKYGVRLLKDNLACKVIGYKMLFNKLTLCVKSIDNETTYYVPGAEYGEGIREIF